MRFDVTRKIIITSFMLIAAYIFSVYAKVNPYAGEVEAPVADPKISVSENTIITEEKYKPYGPLNPIKPGIDVNEKNSVDNFYIDLKTLETRIKYFSPTYLNAKANAETSYWMAYYVRGGNDALVYDQKSFDEIKVYKDQADEFKENLDNAQYELNNLDKKDPEYDTKYAMLMIQIATYKAYHKAYMSGYSMANATISKTKSALGLKNALHKIATVDDNGTISEVRRTITQKLTSLVTNYLQLNSYLYILDRTQNLRDDMYKLKLEQYELGQVTALEVKTSLSDYESAKVTYKTMKTTLTNLKEQLSINLGYNIIDMNRLVFVEPEIDLLLIANINIDNDRDRAYNSNSSYTSIKMSDKDRRFPQSTGEELYNKRKNYVAEKVVVELENLYQKLESAVHNYNANTYLEEIYKINAEANKRKLDNNLISKLEFDALEIQNLANLLQIRTAKYDLINAYNDYYYGALGNITIS